MKHLEITLKCLTWKLEERVGLALCSGKVRELSRVMLIPWTIEEKVTELLGMNTFHI